MSGWQRATEPVAPPPESWTILVEAGGLPTACGGWSRRWIGAGGDRAPGYEELGPFDIPLPDGVVIPILRMIKHAR